MLSAPHLILVFLVALLVFGPEKLPELARNMSKWMAEFRRYSGDFQETIQREMRQLEHDAMEHNRSKSQPELASASSPGSSEAVSQHEDENPAATSDGTSPEGASPTQEDDAAYAGDANGADSVDASGGESEAYRYDDAYSGAEMTEGPEGYDDYDAGWQPESAEAGSDEPLGEASTSEAPPAAAPSDEVKSSTEENSPASTGAEQPVNDHPSAA